MTLLSKILAGVACLFFIISIVLGAFVLSKDHEITILQTSVETLRVDNEVLSQRVENCQKICEAQQAATQHQQTEIDYLREKEKTFLEKLDLLNDPPIGDKVNENKNVSRADDLLPSDLAGMLHESCKSVRGKACSN